MIARLASRLPAASWWVGYDRRLLADDALAGVVVTILLIPQSLAYALLAGVPAEAGLYASMAPMLVYAVFGSSRVLAVGPVAVISLMTASALSDVVASGTAGYAAAAAMLALLSGGMLLVMGLLRMGWLANFLSHPVITGFVSASAVLIAAGQLQALLGLNGAHGSHFPSTIRAVAMNAGAVDFETALIGVGTLAFLWTVRSKLTAWLVERGMSERIAGFCTRAGPVVAVMAGTLAVKLGGLSAHGVSVVGEVPAGLPPFEVPTVDTTLVRALLPSAALIAAVGFVESISVAQSLAMRRRQRVSPNRELVGLGMANLSAGVTGGFPVTGGFSRSLVNFDAGAVTPMAGVITAGLMGLTAMVATPLFHDLPHAVLAAIIIVAVLALVDVRGMAGTLRYSLSDGAPMLLTVAVVLGVGLEAGIVAGVVASVLLFLWRTSRPHMAVIGRVPGTEHFRNVDRHRVLSSERVLAVRVDESLYFANARYLEDRLNALVVEREAVTDVVLVCNAVNFIDASAIETLDSLNATLGAAGIRFHLSEVKGPVMDALERSQLLQRLSGEVFFTQHEAMTRLAPEVAREPAAQ